MTGGTFDSCGLFLTITSSTKKEEINKKEKNMNDDTTVKYEDFLFYFWEFSFV